MCPYLYLSHHNTHTFIQSNRRILWSLHRFSCIPTSASNLSTSCCSCILNVGCCWLGRALAVPTVFCAILASRGVLFLLLTFVPSSIWVLCFELGATVIKTWKGRGSVDCAFVPFLFDYDTLFWVLVPLSLLLWRRYRSLWRCRNGIVALVAAAPIFVAF